MALQARLQDLFLVKANVVAYPAKVLAKSKAMLSADMASVTWFQTLFQVPAFKAGY